MYSKQYFSPSTSPNILINRTYVCYAFCIKYPLKAELDQQFYVSIRSIPKFDFRIAQPAFMSIRTMR